MLLLLSEELSSLLSDSIEGFSPSPSVLAFDFSARENDSPSKKGWSASREFPPVPPGLPSTPQSSWQPYPDTSAPKRKPTEPPEDTPVVVESLDTPAPLTPCVHESIHPVQFGIMPKRLPLPHPDDEILSGYEEDVSSIQDGYTAWVMRRSSFNTGTPPGQ